MNERLTTLIDRLQSASAQAVLRWLILTALVLFIVTLLIFWFGGASFSEKDVGFMIEGPAQARSGDEAVYKLTYRNNTRTELRDLQFRFFYPEDSIVIAADGSFSSKQSEGFEVDKLATGETAEREFKVFLVGDKGDIKTATANMLFRAGTLRSSFEKSASLATTLVGLPVPITLSAPPSAVSGQDVSYVLDYRNDSGSDLADLRLEFTYPDGFTPRDLRPNPAENKNVWTIALLKQGTGGRITITGPLTGNERDTKPVSVVIRRKIQGEYLDYERAESSTVISSPLLNVSILANGSKDYTASLGDTLVYRVQYRNPSNFDLLGLTLSVALDGDMYDLATVEPGSGFFSTGDRTLTWTAGAVPGFGTLAAGAGGTVEFRVRVKKSFPPGQQGAKTFFVKANATLRTPNAPTGIDASEVASQDSVTTKITTQPVLNQALYAIDPAFGGSGSMPPRVGQETVFTVHWQVSNPGNDLSDARLTAVLPPGVTWKNLTSVTSGQPTVTFDANRATATWNLGRLPFGAGTVGGAYEASFQIGLTPSSTQLGSSPTILKNINLSGTDSFTRQPIIVNARDLTTNDTIDKPGQGVVQ